MFHISIWQILLVLVVALLVFGPKQLPEIAHSAGRLISYLKKIIVDVKQEIKNKSDDK